ncbi:MAG: hypothetical protein ACO1N1_02500 [Dyadobacter fermentans]
MPRFSLVITASSDGTIVHNSYNFAMNYRPTESELLQSYQEFYPGHADVEIILFGEIEESIVAEAA